MRSFCYFALVYGFNLLFSNDCTIECGCDEAGRGAWQDLFLQPQSFFPPTTIIPI